MNFNENSNESDWNITPMKKEKDSDGDVKKSTTKTKENRNFCEKWLSIFSPWLTRSEDDPNRPFCRACQRPLDNNRFRLQRHERTAKHARNQEILLNEGEEAVRMCLNKSIKRPKKVSPPKTSTLDVEHITKFETELPFKQKDIIPKRLKKTIEKEERDSPYMFTKRECHDMSDYYYAPLPPSSHSQHSHQPPPPQQHHHHQHLPLPQPKKDSFDMFFEAISATVKSLPPKLAAEVKSRVSQVIAEFELRAICEKEAQEKAQQQSIIAIPTQVANVVTIDPVIATGSNVANTNVANQQTIAQAPSTVTQYVYSYQQKKEIN